MNIVKEMAKAIAKQINADGKVNADNIASAQAAWDVVKAEMLRAAVRERCIDAVVEADAFATGLSGLKR